MDPFATIDRYQLIAGGLHLFTALVWVILAGSYWRSRGTARPQGAVLRLFRILCGILAFHYGLSVVVDLIQPGSESFPILWTSSCVLSKATTLAELAILRHLIPLAKVGGTPPGRLWLAFNYGSAILIGLATVWLGAFSPDAGTLIQAYLLLMTVAIVRDVLRLANDRGGRWRPVIMADLGPRGFAFLGLVMVVAVALIVLFEHHRPEQDLAWAIVHSVAGLALAAVFALRVLGEVVRRLLVTVAGILATGAIYFGTHVASQRVVGELRGLVALVGVLTLVLVLGPMGRWFQGAVDRLVRQQNRRWDQQLLSFLQTLSPELGVVQCQQNAVTEVVRVLKLRGAGMMPGEVVDGATTDVVSDGQLELSSVIRAWPPGEASRQLPEGAFDLLWLNDVKLQEALHDCGVTWVVPVTSPRKRWGYLLVSAGTLGLAAGGARLETLERFVQQLARVLDSADLLGRAVTVERELAQAEKLAAVGEMAARMAHEIRNPVTAARSLSQTLAREPDSPHNAEHAVIITRELDRVEHQVRSLLEFARREIYRFEEVRLADLVRATVADLEPCLRGGQVVHELDLDSAMVVWADPERLRQVLINLVENAADALSEVTGPRRLSITVAEADSRAALVVCDNGPGMSEEVQRRIFDPFYSEKARGTGLGLAVARRIVEAHDGRIKAEAGAESGMVFSVELPTLTQPPGADIAPEPLAVEPLEQAM